jgi:hypothetical protein
VTTQKEISHLSFATDMQHTLSDSCHREYMRTRLMALKATQATAQWQLGERDHSKLQNSPGSRIGLIGVKPETEFGHDSMVVLIAPLCI